MCGAVDRDVGLQLALEHRPDVAAALDRHAVGDERALHARGQRRREVARLVGVRQEHALGLLGRDQLREREHEAVGGVVLQRGIVDDDDFGDVGGGDLARDRRRRPTPSTATFTGPPAVCAAAIVSSVARLSLPSRCSAMTRITAPSLLRAGA